MKRVIILLFVTIICQFTIAQNSSIQWENITQKKQSGISFKEYSIFNYYSDLEASMQETVSDGALLTLNRSMLREMVAQEPEALTLNIPFTSGITITVELTPNRVLTEGFIVTTSGREGSISDYTPGLYYKGVISGDDESSVAISFFNDEVIGILSSSVYGTMELGVLDKDPQNRYVLYRSSDFLIPFDFHCDALDPDNTNNNSQILYTESGNPNNCVRLYFEAEYDTYLEKGSVNNVVNFITGIYNVVAVLYSNDGIQTVISEIFVWDTPDSYATSSPLDALLSFRSYRPSYNGDIAHLMSRGTPTNGGVAWVNTLCGSFAYSYSYVHSTYNQFPTYSWTVNVVTHEIGHNLGSQHTHDCVWDVSNNGIANEPIDGCGPTAGYPGTGSCSTAPLPTNGGTIMSYCHLLGNVGINFNNGFGPLPGELIRQKVYNATCLSPCVSCAISLNITKTDIPCYGASTGEITVTASGGISPYSYAWSNNMTGNHITGLAAGTYTVTVTDSGSNCSVIDTIDIFENSIITLQTIPTNATGICNGSIDLIVNGGTAPHTFLWSNNETTQNINNLCSGTYTVTVTDNNGCTALKSEVISSSTCLNIVNSFPYSESFETGLGLWSQCNTDNFDWTQNSGGTPTSNTGPSSAFDGTWYMFTNASANIGSAYLVSPCLDLIGLTSPEAEFAYHMFGNHIGTLQLQASNDDGASWVTLWSASGNQGNQWFTASVSLQGFQTAATIIRFTATLSGPRFGDIAIDAVTIKGTTPPCTPPLLAASSTSASCHGGNDGNATVIASGGVAPYSYLWSNNSINSSISALSAGTYSVTVTDAVNCSASASVIVSQPPAVELSFSVTPANIGASDGSVALSVAGGTTPYSCTWNTNTTGFNITSIPTGTYTATVADANACTMQQSIFVPEISGCNNIVNNYPYSESFETGLGLWEQSTSDNFDWTRHSGSTPLKNSGPSSASDGSYYMYIASESNTGMASLISPCLDFTNTNNPQLSFAYHMYGNNMGTLTIEASTDIGKTWSTLWSLSGNQGNTWYNQTVSLSSCQGSITLIRFIGQVGGMRSNMAIDNIVLTAAPAIPSSLILENNIWNWTSLYPNPAKDKMTLRFFAETEAGLPVFITDALGRKFFIGTAEIAPGENNISFPINGYSAGVYYITAGSGENQQTRMLLITP